jgi:hypothetical protein
VTISPLKMKGGCQEMPKKIETVMLTVAIEERWYPKTTTTVAGLKSGENYFARSAGIALSINQREPHQKRKRPRLRLESRDARSNSPPPKSAHNHPTF